MQMKDPKTNRTYQKCMCFMSLKSRNASILNDLSIFIKYVLETFLETFESFSIFLVHCHLWINSKNYYHVTLTNFLKNSVT